MKYLRVMYLCSGFVCLPLSFYDVCFVNRLGNEEGKGGRGKSCCPSEMPISAENSEILHFNGFFFWPYGLDGDFHIEN